MNLHPRKIAVLGAVVLIVGILIGILISPGTTNELKNLHLYVDPDSSVQKWISEHKNSEAARAELFKSVAAQPQALWLTGTSDNVTKLSRVMNQSSLQGTMPVVVLYNVPNRDCGQHSAGGTAANDYKKWVDTISNTIGSKKTLIIVEPDALAGLDCLDDTGKEERLSLIKYAVETLNKNDNAYIYIDAGHPDWQTPKEIAKRLQKSGIRYARGFALNVSNFHTNDEVVTYGRSIRNSVGGKKTFVIDTSRNGNGPAMQNEWCNPKGRALGISPTTTPNLMYVDAFLWVKNIGESDGECNGGPKAGLFWADYVGTLVKQTQI